MPFYQCIAPVGIITKAYAPGDDRVLALGQ
jgi:hypothetical protein